MSDEQKPGDPADKAADGAFGGVQSHRAGYGDDKLARLIGWLRSYPHATLASGEGALLLAEIDRLRDDLQKQTDWADWAKGEIDRLTVELGKGALRLEIEMLTVERDRAERILAALRKPSKSVSNAVWTELCLGATPEGSIRAAVTAAEQEVERE